MRILVLRESKRKNKLAKRDVDSTGSKPSILVALKSAFSNTYSVTTNDNFDNIIKIYLSITKLYLKLRKVQDERTPEFRKEFLDGIHILIKNKELPKNSYTIYRICCSLFKGLEGNPEYARKLNTHPIKKEGKFSMEDTYKRKFRLGDKNIKIFQSYFSRKNESRVYWLMSPDERNKLIIVGYVPNHPNNSNEKIYSRIVSDFSDYRDNLIQIDTGSLPPDNSKALIEEQEV